MTLADVFTQQIMDPFRIGLVIMLVLTAVRTQAATGTVLPLALGVVFIAVLIPMTLSNDDPDKLRSVLVGVATNVVILAVVLAVKRLVTSFLRP